MLQSSKNAMSETIAPIIVTAEMEAADQAWAEALRQRYFPPERNQLRAHITLLRHLAPSLQDELQTLLKKLTQAPKPRVIIGSVSSLGQGVAIGLHSSELIEIWSLLARRFEYYLTPQDQHQPRLHITVQNKVTSQVAKATLTELEAASMPRSVEIAALACWHYRGGPWSLIGRHAFRGARRGRFP